MHIRPTCTEAFSLSLSLSRARALSTVHARTLHYVALHPQKSGTINKIIMDYDSRVLMDTVFLVQFFFLSHHRPHESFTRGATLNRQLAIN